MLVVNEMGLVLLFDCKSLSSNQQKNTQYHVIITVHHTGEAATSHPDCTPKMEDVGPFPLSASLVLAVPSLYRILHRPKGSSGPRAVSFIIFNHGQKLVFRMAVVSKASRYRGKVTGWDVGLLIRAGQ